MSQNSTRFIVIILGLFTAIVHLVILNISPDGVFPQFVLNGLGYFALLAAFSLRIPKGQERLVHYGFMAFALITIIAWIAVGARTPLGYSTKAVEVLLIVFLWLDLQRLQVPKKI
jgi:hypothetical protein